MFSALLAVPGYRLFCARLVVYYLGVYSILRIEFKLSKI